MKKLRLGEVQQLTPNHEARKWLSLSLTLYIIQLFMSLHVFPETRPGLLGPRGIWEWMAEDRQHLRLCRHPTADVMSKISPCGANGGADGGSLLRVLWPRLLCWAPWACEGLDPIPELLPSGLASHINTKLWHSSVQFSCSVVSNYLRPHEPQRARPPCPSPTPGVHSDTRPSSQ